MVKIKNKFLEKNSSESLLLMLFKNRPQLIQLWKIQNAWKKIVGMPLAIHTYPKKIQGKILYVSVGHSTWMHHLHFMKQDIVKNLNSEVQFLIEDIKFSQESIPEAWQKK